MLGRLSLPLCLRQEVNVRHYFSWCMCVCVCYVRRKLVWDVRYRLWWVGHLVFKDLHSFVMRIRLLCKHFPISFSAHMKAWRAQKSFLGPTELEMCLCAACVCVLPVCRRSSRSRRPCRLVLFDDVFDVMTGIQALGVIWSGLDHILRRRTPCWTWYLIFFLRYILKDRILRHRCHFNFSTGMHQDSQTDYELN